jgi:hypothetical protein
MEEGESDAGKVLEEKGSGGVGDLGNWGIGELG